MKRGNKPQLQQCFSVERSSDDEDDDDDDEGETGEESESEEEGDLEDDPSAIMATKLAKDILREFLQKHHFKKTLEAFEMEANSDGSTFNPKALQEDLKLSEIIAHNKSKKGRYSVFSLLEHMVSDRMNNATTKKKKIRKGSGTPYQLLGSGETVIIDNYELSSHRVRHVSEGVAATSLTQGKLINDVSELDFSKEVLLGSGASGHVYQVLHVPSGEYVAVKKISIHEEHRRKEIVKELHLLYSNVHITKNVVETEHLLGLRYVVRFYGAFFDEGNTLIALECMVGSLDDAIGEVKVIEEEVLKAISWQVVSALYYLNKAHHVQHRDIKAANILLGKDGRVRLSDFGVASDEKAATQAQAQTFVGTVIYMSPERLHGKSYNNNADIWSLGLVLIHAATGRHPFKGMDPYKIMSLVDYGTLPSLPNTFSKDFREFVDKCLIRNPNERPSAEIIRTHRWISGLNHTRTERVILEWSDPIVARLEMRKANKRETKPLLDAGQFYDILDGELVT